MGCKQISLEKRQAQEEKFRINSSFDSVLRGDEPNLNLNFFFGSQKAKFDFFSRFDQHGGLPVSLLTIKISCANKIVDLSSLAKLLPSSFLTVLELIRCGIEDLTPLKGALPNTLRKLNLFRNHITDITPLVVSLPNALEILNLSANQITDFLPLLQECESHKSLKNLSIKGNPTGMRLGFSLSQSDLEVLDISWNELGPNSLFVFPPSLQNLNLSSNFLSNPKVFRDVLKTLDRLTTLNLTHNGIGDLSGLMGYLPYSLEKLILTDNPITSLVSGFKPFCPAFHVVFLDDERFEERVNERIRTMNCVVAVTSTRLVKRLGKASALSRLPIELFRELNTFHGLLD